MSQARRFCFTWNNYPEDVREILWAQWEDRGSRIVDYYIYGKEKGESGTPHLQGYVEFKSGMRFDTLAKRLPGVHWTKVDGSAKQNIAYCSKGVQSKEEWEEHGTDGPHYGLSAEIYTFGKPKEQGKRVDIKDAMKDIENGMDEMSFIETHTDVACRYNRTMDRYRLLCEKKRSRGYNKKEVIVLWGDSGTGKTRKAVEENPDAFILRETSTGYWWDGYDGEEVVIIEEFLGQVPLCQLLGWLDGYSCQVAVKGGTKLLMAKKIIFTSNVDPMDWYKGVDERRREAFRRRIDSSFFFKKDATEVRGGNSDLPVFPEVAKLQREERKEFSLIDDYLTYRGKKIDDNTNAWYDEETDTLHFG